MKRVMFLCAAIMLAIVFTSCSLEGDSKSETQADQGQENVSSTKGEKASENETFAESQDPVYEYEAGVIRYSELSGEFSFRKDVEVTRTDHAAYYFETSIGMAERNACIAVTDQALSCIDAALPEIEIVVLSPESYDGILVSGNRLYMPVESWDSVDYIAKVLLAGYGEWSNYGMAYGYADYLCRKAGIGSGEANLDGREETLEDGKEVSDDRDTASGGRETASGEQENRRFLSAKDPESYDLTLLCFDTRFVPAEDVEAAKNNACLFVDEYLTAHSEEDFLELLSLSGTSEGVEHVNEELEAFYEEHGVECCLTKIRYQYGGVTFDYAAACEYARFYINKDWQEMYWEANQNISEDFLHEDYAEVKAFFECHAEQMAQYQDLFGFAQYNNDLVILFTNKLNMPSTYNGLYYPDSHTIYLSAVMSLMHEYIHSVMYGNYDQETLWKREGSAQYFTNRYNRYYPDFYNGIARYYMDHDEYAQEVLGFLISFLGRELDVRTDFRTIVDLSEYLWGNADPNLSYDAAASFVGYLVEQYGERAAIQYICSDDEYNAEWDKSYEELVQDWNHYIEENYSWYERK